MKWSFFFRDRHVRAHGINVNTGTVAAIAAAYAVVKKAEGHELVRATFVDTASTVHTRFLSHGAIANLLQAMGDRPRGTNPFDSAQVLLNIISKGRTTQGIEWVMEKGFMTDYLLNVNQVAFLLVLTCLMNLLSLMILILST
jgi:hypothetical protein